MRPTRFTYLKAAIVLAVGFVMLRIVYRIVFGGAGGNGVVLLELPRIRLVGPFEHITLFGDVTTGGITNAAASAIPFAALVLAIGTISAVVNIRRLLTRGADRGPVRTVARALVVALATFPALLDAVRRVRRARELRGERGAASLIIPVLEHTVERAVALGASMEVRGFAAAKRAEPRCEHPAIIRDASLGYRDRWSLAAINLEFTPGTLTVITGATGSGKSTLLSALSGLFQHVLDGTQLGSIEVAGLDRDAVPPRETAGFVGVVSQSVRVSFVAATVAEELGFALVIRGVAPIIVEARVAEIAGRLGIAHLLPRETCALSAGEACLVAIGAALIEHPVLLLVDEPLADLDEPARARVVDVLDRLAHQAGVCVIVAEHTFSEWADRPDAWLELREGAVHRIARPTQAPDYSATGTQVVGAQAAVAQAAGSQSRHAPIAEITKLSVWHGELAAVVGASLTLRPAEIVALRGPNGAGKSSLLHAIARPNQRGVVVIDTRDVYTLSRRQRRRAVALVPEVFDDLLFATTVEAECARADRRAAASGTALRFTRLLGIELDTASLNGRTSAIMASHPRDLSAGERLCLVIAIQLSARPRVLLVDEPSRGLDAAARALVGAAIVEAAAAGAAVLIATHDRDFASRYATGEFTMGSGRLEAGAGVIS